MYKKVLACLACVLVLLCFALPSFATGVINDDTCDFVLNTALTLCGNTVRPVVNATLGLTFGGELGLSIYNNAPNWGEYDSKYDSHSFSLPLSYDIKDSDNAPWTVINLTEHFGSTFGYVAGIYWEDINNDDGQYAQMNYIYNDARDYFCPNDLTGLFRAYTPSNNHFDSYAGWNITGYTITYVAPNVENEIVTVGAGLVGAQAVRNALKNLGFTQVVFNLTAPESVTANQTIIVEWLGYCGTASFSSSVVTNDGVASGATLKQQYESGYQAGLAVGQQGKINYGEGRYQDGFKAGQESDKLIPSLIYAIADVPFQIISDFLDFEILGFDVGNLINTILTTMLIVWAVKLFV